LFKHKKHLFFDLDHTLWDFDANAFDCLKEIHEDFGLGANDIALTDFHQTFSRINKELWTKLELKQIEHDDIRSIRFKNALEELGLIMGRKMSEAMNRAFLDLLPYKKKLVEDCVEVLETLKPNYQLHILSNGFHKIQKNKLANSGIHKYFTKVITNDIAGFRKPEAGIFEFALKKTHARPEDSLMIGDSHLADIIGAKNVGWDTIHFDQENNPKELLSTIKITKLSQLLPLF
jgi:YjjG family noncanonical pyrimidine nucleotidase